MPVALSIAIAFVLGCLTFWVYSRITVIAPLVQTLQRRSQFRAERFTPNKTVVKALDQQIVTLQRDLGAATVDAHRASVALSATHDAISLADAEGRIVLTNGAFDELQATPILGPLVTAQINAAHIQVAASGFFRRDIEVFGPPRRVFLLDGNEVADGYTVISARDVTALDRSEQVRRDFVANVSHELQTPVAALSLLAETLVDETDTEVQRRLGERLVGEASRLSRIIDELLELSKLEGSNQFVTEMVPVASAVAEAVARHRYVANEANVSLEVHDIDPVLSLEAERASLVSAIGNLVENAIKYSPSGTVEVSVDVTDASVAIVVADDGVGIPRADLGRVFERFYRVDRSRSVDTGGTGLGLSIVRHVAENHGGTVTVESTEGVGTTFTLTLPWRSPTEAVSAGVASERS